MWSDGEDDLFDDFADAAANGDAQVDNDSNVGYRIVVNFNNDTGEAVVPSNEFEKMLFRDGIEVRSDENYKKYMHIGSDCFSVAFHFITISH
ncbi:unnamed protein product [Strongylus vulgaris]|uniref:Uncharacterized protein n=1 Tax=Strongylus vulgaris TaxID=40348 RepID=A0A3P7LIC4_STRVU|nr:unnamed protein product [Strongylus vulgaris]